MERIYNRKNKYNGGNNNWNIIMKRNEPFRVNKLQLVFFRRKLSYCWSRIYYFTNIIFLLLHSKMFIRQQILSGKVKYSLIYNIAWWCRLYIHSFVYFQEFWISLSPKLGNGELLLSVQHGKVSCYLHGR